MKHILSTKQFTRSDIEYLMAESRNMDELLLQGGSHMYDKKIMATLFYEPSTRTRLSFESAMLRLGWEIISETDVTFSSQSKWEILADTIRMVSGYSDIIALRSKNVGDAIIASQYSTVPIINAGDGPGEHPTQSLLDLYTITKNFPQILLDETVHITFIGDLYYGRTVHSLAMLLRNFPRVSLTFVAPENLNLPENYHREGDSFTNTLSDEILASSDVIYMTRVQKERFSDVASYEAIKNTFIFDVSTVKKMHPKAILMHPLPRVHEILPEVDDLPQAKYFEQARNAVPVRMAIIKYCLES